MTDLKLPENSTSRKLSIVVFSGDFDKAVAAFTLASGAAAVNWEVNLFFTFWGLNILKKKRGRSPLGRGLLARAFGWMLGGVDKLPLSRLNFGGISPKLMTGLMKDRNVATLDELIQASKDLGVTFTACEMSMHILGLKKEDFIDEVRGVVGVPSFLDTSKDAHILFIS
jgi:peroxiredoxin family protein